MKPYECKICGHEKLSWEDWWLLGFRNSMGAVIAKWDDELAQEGTVNHLCSPNCAAIWTSRQAEEMTQRNLPPKEQPVSHI